MSANAVDQRGPDRVVRRPPVGPRLGVPPPGLDRGAQDAVVGLGKRRVPSVAKPRNSEPVELSSTRSRSPDRTRGARGVVRHRRRAGLAAGPGERVVGQPLPRGARRRSPSPGAPPAGCRRSAGRAGRRSPRPGRPRARARTRRRCSSGCPWAAPRALSPMRWTVVHVTGERDADGEVVQHVPRPVAVDLHQADLGLAVLVVPQARVHGQRAPVGRVGERAEQQRHVVVRVGVGDLEDHDDLGVERRAALRGEVVAAAEHQPVHALVVAASQPATRPSSSVTASATGTQSPFVRRSHRTPTPRAGAPRTASRTWLDRLIRPPPASAAGAGRSRRAPGVRRPARCRRRGRAARSSAASISSADRPAARIRKTCPKRSS